ncbi:hypothetical protein [Pelagicoccus mobilis]|uniref:Uncharacterized protein n=1 Tax=Pelagicoccus mobilis TaxID=415221 RepID=A0A934RUT5_9BACT|nr:hypothetical protein [Pelagicoccus mobilis]MBK1875236.1 hypothetical protein [Pelagicoccus mobilis]
MKIPLLLTLGTGSLLALVLFFTVFRESSLGLEAEGANETSRTATQVGSEDAPRSKFVSSSASGSEVDFEGRYRVLSALRNGPGKVVELEELFAEWAAEEGEPAFEFALGLQGRDRLSFMGSAAAAWAETDPDAAWEAMMAVSNGGKMLVPQLAKVAKSIADTDPRLATELLLGVESQLNRQELFGRVVSSFKTDEVRNRVLEVLVSSEVNGTEFMVESLFRDWGRYDSESPIRALDRLGDASLAKKAMLGILSGWASVDGRGAFDYVLRSGDEALVSSALSTVAEEWVGNSTADELPGIVELISSLEGDEAVLKNLISPLARVDPALALESVAGFENASARAWHTQDAMRQWAISDLDAAEEYFLSMPAGRTKDYAIWGLFNPAIKYGASAERILSHADSLETPKSIEIALINLSEYVRVRDLGEQTDSLIVAIEDYVANSDKLSDEFRQELLENLPSPEG